MSSRSMPAVLFASVLVASLLPGCAGGGAPGDGRADSADTLRTSRAASDAPFGAVEIPDVAGPDERLQIGIEATRGLDDFVASDRVVIGEHTTVDMTRTPFLAMSAFTLNPDDVRRTERRDDTNGLLIITLTNRTGVKTHLPSLPQVEIGGLLFVGVEQLVLRYSLHTDMQRPIRLRAVAERKAVYQQIGADRNERGARVLLEMEIAGTGDAARFSEHVRVDP